MTWPLNSNAISKLRRDRAPVLTSGVTQFFITFILSLVSFFLITRGHFELGKDAAYFYSTANALWRDGRFVVEAFVTPHAGRFGVLYPLVLSPFFAIAEWRERIEWIYFFQAASFASTLALVDLLARKFLVRTVPRILLVSALLTHLPLLHIFTELSVEVVVLPVFVLLIYLHTARPAPPLAVLALLSSIMVLARPASVALLAPLALLYWQRQPSFKKTISWFLASLVLPFAVQYYRSSKEGSALFHFEIVEWRLELIPLDQLGEIIATAFFPGVNSVAYLGLALVFFILIVGATRAGHVRQLVTSLGIYFVLIYILSTATLSLADSRFYWQPRYAIMITMGLAVTLVFIERAPFRQLALSLLAFSTVLNLFSLAGSSNLKTDYRSEFMAMDWESDPCYENIAGLKGKLVYSNDIELLYVLSEGNIRYQRYIPGMLFNNFGVYRKRPETPRYGTMFSNLARDNGRLVHLARAANYTEVPSFGDAPYNRALELTALEAIPECAGPLIKIYRLQGRHP